MSVQRKKKCPASAPSKRRTSERGRGETRVSLSRQDCFLRSISPEKPSVTKKKREATAIARLRSFAKSVEAEERKHFASSSLLSDLSCAASAQVGIPRSPTHKHLVCSNAGPDLSARRDSKANMVGRSLAVQQLSDDDDPPQTFNIQEELRVMQRDNIVGQERVSPSYVGEVESRVAALQQQVSLKITSSTKVSLHIQP